MGHFPGHIIKSPQKFRNAFHLKIMNRPATTTTTTTTTWHSRHYKLQVAGCQGKS